MPIHGPLKCPQTCYESDPYHLLCKEIDYKCWIKWLNGPKEKDSSSSWLSGWKQGPAINALFDFVFHFPLRIWRISFGSFSPCTLVSVCPCIVPHPSWHNILKKVLTTTQTLEFLASIAAISGLRSKSYHAELNKQINNASLGPICPTYLKLPHGFNGCLRQMYLISHKACIKMSNAHNERWIFFEISLYQLATWIRLAKS